MSVKKATRVIEFRLSREWGTKGLPGLIPSVRCVRLDPVYYRDSARDTG